MSALVASPTVLTKTAATSATGVAAGYYCIVEPTVSKTEEAATQRSTLRQQFSLLADRWELETGALSLVSQKIAHRDFLKLVSLGPKTIPFILERLPLKPHNWFIALDALADEIDRPNTIGINPRAAVEKWLEWGRRHGWTANA